MNKKLLAIAVASALAVPGIALADGSSVTISGFVKEGLENLHISSGTNNAALGLVAPNRANSSENRIMDNSSRIVFDVKEDLGGGLSAIAQLDTRFNPHASSGGVASGNTWVGLHSTQWGNITIGNRDLHYYHTADTLPSGATALDGWSVGLLGFVPEFNATGGASTSQIAIANDTRTKNVIEYASPKWGMFEFGLAYSTDPYGTTGALGSVPATCTGACTTQNSYGWNFAPQLRGGNWVAGFSYYKAQAPASANTLPDQKSDRLWGYYKFAQGFRVGLTWDRSEYDTHSATSEQVKRNAWSLPLSYSWGPNTVGWTHTVAQNVSVSGAPAGFSSSDTGAKLDALYYEYALSKRTMMGVTYSYLKNDTNAAYNLFTSTALGTSDAAVSAGEDPRALQFTLMHAF